MEHIVPKSEESICNEETWKRLKIVKILKEKKTECDISELKRYPFQTPTTLEINVNFLCSGVSLNWQICVPK